MRALMGPTIGTPIPNLDTPTYHSSREGIAYLYDIMERDGPFDGIIGYSEGGTVAATLLLHEQRRFEVEGREPMFKCAIFFAGWPPMNPDLNAVVLADESDLQINIPTCHVSKYSLICYAYIHTPVSGIMFSILTLDTVGSLDPYLGGSMALYNVCDLDTAFLFDHAKGHTLPRDRETVKELGDTIRAMCSTILCD
jgi:hypothetical protein